MKIIYSCNYLDVHVVVVVADESVHVAKVRVETPGERCELPVVVAQVPLSKQVRPVAQVLHVLRQKLLVQRQSPGLGWRQWVTLHPCAKKKTQFSTRSGESLILTKCL